MTTTTVLHGSASTMAAALWLCLGAQTAAAQTTASTAQPETAASAPQASVSTDQTTDDGGLRDIIVTAQRRSENLQRAAIAVTAVQEEALVRANVLDTTQLTRVAPALQIGNIAGAANAFYLRGVGNFTTNSLSDSAVSFNLDGVTLSRNLAAQGVYYDLERIEVLKGPQGTLYGRNATGGAINVVTAKPQLGSFGGDLAASYGNFDAVKLTGAINVPIGDTAAIRIAGLFSNRDGFYSDGTSDDRTRAVRAQALVELTPDIKLSAGADFAHQGGIGAGATVVGLDRNRRLGLSSPEAQAAFTRAYAPLAGAFLQGVPRDSFNDNDFAGAYLQLDAKTPIGTLTILPAYRYVSVFQRSYAAALSYNERLKADQYSVEARLASDTTGSVSYLAGLYFLSEDIDERPSYNQQFFSPYNTFLTQTKSYAAFGRLTVNVTDRFRVNGGARYTIDDKAAQLSGYQAVVICRAAFAGGNCIGTPPLPNTFDVPAQFVSATGAPLVLPWGSNGAIVQITRPSINASNVFRKATWRAGLEYDVGPSSLLYATVETGFKSGGFFSTADDPVYDPETITAYTLGSKNRFLDNRLQLNVEGFFWEYKDQQVSFFRTNSLGGTEFVTDNIGRTRVLGAEVEAIARVAAGTTLNLNVQYLNTRYQNFTYRIPSTLGNPVTGCPFSAPVNGVITVDCTGRRAPHSPTLTLVGGIEQVVQLGGGNKLTFNADGRYQSWVYTGFEQLPRQRQDGYFLADLQARLDLAGTGFSVAAFVNNLTDQNVAGFSLPQQRSPTLLIETLRPPRTYGMRVQYRF